MGKHKRKRIVKRQSKKAGMAPGSLVYIGGEEHASINISAFCYNPEHLAEPVIKKIEESFNIAAPGSVAWINIDGLSDIEIIESVGKHFNLHSLVLEDIVNTCQRPKIEDYDGHSFIVLKMLSYDDETHFIDSEQVSLILGENYVISFQEKPGDVFNSIRERLRSNKGRIRKMGSDFLLYALIDAIVDNYYIILEKMNDKLEELEEEVLDNESPEIMQQIHNFKRELMMLRKSVWPLREMINNLEKGDSNLISQATSPFFRDVYDHTIGIIDTIESFRDTISGVQDVYMTCVSNRMNNIMKVLTIIATIFIPLTFIAGVYGMNFKYMPELDWRWSYPVVWFVMVGCILGMLWFFKKNKWL